MKTPTERKAEILIVGGGIGGCAASLAALQAGSNVILTEESDWIGGQSTSQAVPPDEHGWIERFGCTASYRRFRERVRDYYRRNYPLTEAARKSVHLNPGNGWVSPLCHEPRAALAVLEEMLAPWISSGRLTLLLRQKSIAAATGGDRVEAVSFRDLQDGSTQTIAADLFLDATELGDLLPLAGIEHVTGFESRAMTGEPSAPAEYQPRNSQAFSICFAMDHLEGEDHTIERPAGYEFWRNYIPDLEPSWPGPLLSWTITHPRLMTPHTYHFDPGREPSKAFSGLWTYRRILDRANLAAGAQPSDICLVNWPQTDYLQSELCRCGDEERAFHIAAAREQSLSLFYWLQTEAPRPDGGAGWRGLRLRGDVTGSADGLAKMPYIRESRRICAAFTVLEQHVAEASRPGEKLAERYADSVGIGHYRIDLHPSTGGDNYIDVASLPFRIPLGALIPVRVENLLPACKNIGTTHITNGCYRLHPVEWNIGEAAGTLAALAARDRTTPRALFEGRLDEIQRLLARRGVELAWPEDLALEEGDSHIHAR
ncbi:MAG: FAD-dependent oxidoreductase [Blastocatellia bacterium]